MRATPPRIIAIGILLGLVASCAPVDDEVGAEGDPLAIRHIERITTISYAPNSYVIGNAYPGWTVEVQGQPQFSYGPGNPDGHSYRWGYLLGADFDRCAWIDNDDLAPGHIVRGSRCGSPQEIDTPYFLSTYTNGEHNDLAGDGSVTHMHYAGSGCSDHRGYGNVEPWRVPATPHNVVGDVPDGKELRWRYVSHDGHWVLVRDPHPPSDQPNWYFVHRGCVSLQNRN